MGVRRKQHETARVILPDQVATEDMEPQPGSVKPKTPVVSDLKAMLQQQEMQELNACWTEIRAILNKYNARMIPTVTILGTDIKADVTLAKNQ